MIYFSQIKNPPNANFIKEWSTNISYLFTLNKKPEFKKFIE